jgi:hypothetical protein
VLEAGDLNDSQILAATRQAKDERGATQFSLVLPSKRKLVSEWIAEDKLRDALQVWLDTVRREVVEDARAERIARAHAHMLAQTGTDKQSASGIPSTSPATAPSAADHVVAAGVDPLEYAKARVKLLTELSSSLNVELGSLSSKLTTVDKQLSQWTKILSSLTESNENV